MLSPVRGSIVVAVAVVLVAAGPASASLGSVEVRSASGQLVARAGGGKFLYPADGSLVAVGGVHALPTGVEVDDVSLLGGRVRATRVVVGTRGQGSRIDGLLVDGLLRLPRANSIYSLDGAAYLVALQKAVVRGRDTRR